MLKRKEAAVAQVEDELVGVRRRSSLQEKEAEKSFVGDLVVVVVVVIVVVEENRSRALKSGLGKYGDRSRRARLQRAAALE